MGSTYLAHFFDPLGLEEVSRKWEKNMDHMRHLHCYIFQRIWGVDSECYQDNVCFRIGERPEALFMFITKMDKDRSSTFVLTSYSSWPLRVTLVEQPLSRVLKETTYAVSHSASCTG